MAKNIEFMGAVFPDVPSVQLPQYGGGLVAFDDTTDADATAEDIAEGKTAYVNGAKITGTGSGGGGGISADDVAIRTISGAVSGSAGYIASFAFMYCSNITTANFPNASYISASAFAYCSRLTEANFPSCSSIGPSVFNTCSDLTTINFPSCITIAGYAFGNCKALSEANFPLCERITGTAFANCTSLTSISFPKCSSIAGSAFSGCKKLTEAEFPLCTSLNTSAFKDCNSLRKASFPLCRNVPSSAFYSCYSLSTAIFSHSNASQGTIYTYAFASCYNLLSLYLLASKAYVLSTSSTVFQSTPISNYTTSTGGVHGSIFVPALLYSYYKTLGFWSYFSSRFASLTDAEIQNVLTYGTHNP